MVFNWIGMRNIIIMVEIESLFVLIFYTKLPNSKWNLAIPFCLYLLQIPIR